MIGTKLQKSLKKSWVKVKRCESIGIFSKIRADVLPLRGPLLKAI